MTTTPTGVPIVNCTNCGCTHSVLTRHCTECGRASKFLYGGVCIQCNAKPRALFEVGA